MSELIYFERIGIDDPEKREKVQKKINAVLAENTKSFFAEYCRKDRVLRVDDRFHQFMQYEVKEGESIDDSKIVFRPDYPAMCEFLNPKGEAAGNIQTGTFRLYTNAVSYEWFRVISIPEDGADSVVLIFSNIEQEMLEKEKLKLLDHQDEITYLPNFETFLENTAERIKQDPDQEYAVIRLDVERFKMINQLYGRDEGNHVLRYIAVKIQEIVEAETDGEGTYCHMAFDIFGICIPNEGNRVDRVIRYLQEELKTYPIVFQLVLSFGVYIYADIDRREQTPVELAMSRAQTAQRLNKGNYEKHVGYYNDELRRLEHTEQFVVSEMNHALEQNQFVLYLQPKCSMKTGEIVGSEALVRWIHPERGMISPGEFIPVFENNGFITVLDKYMIEASCKTIRRWIDEGQKVYPISVNVSRIDLYAADLLPFIEECVNRYEVPHEYIEFELTESAFVSDSVMLSDLMTELQYLDFKVLMDDFGSGYSSLNTLKDIAVDVLKIDLKFLPITQEETRAKIILEAVVKMADRLGMKIVVEGVETIEQAELLCSIGCEIAQGFYYYRPMPVAGFEELFDKVLI